MVHINPKNAQLYIDIVKKRTASKKDVQKKIGLGQVIKHKEIFNNDWDNIDFCSKISCSQGQIQTFNIYRNPRKTLYTKQYYIKKNANIFNNPAIHPFALLLGIKSQKMSKLLENIL